MKKGMFFNLLIALIALAWLTPTAADAFFGFGKYETVEAKDGVVQINASDVDDGQVHYFQFSHKDKQIKFFVVKSRDNVFRAAFDACDVCYREGKGYAGDGDTVVCNNCNQRFAARKINEVKGGCNPAPLARTVAASVISIKASDILAGAGYF